MLDRGEFWQPSPAVGATLEAPGLSVELLGPVPQLMLSGDLEAGLARFGVAQAVGLMAETNGSIYALRLARGRALIVGAGLDGSVAGWESGVATTPMTGALAVLEIRGPRAMELVVRASAIDFRKASPCAALNFAGVTCVLSRHEEALRLHLDRGLVGYMLDWMASSGAF